MNTDKSTKNLNIFRICLSIAISMITVNAKANDKFDQSVLCTRYFPQYEAAFKLPEKLLNAVSIIETGRWNKAVESSVSWPWTVNNGGDGHHFDTKIEAVAKVKQLIKDGKTNIDVGCMQVNLKYHPNAFRSLDQALEPKYNIGYAANLLRQHQKKYNDWRKSIAMYHSGDSNLGKKYSNKVLKAWQTQLTIAGHRFDTNQFNIPSKGQFNVTSRTAEDNQVSDLTKLALQRFKY